MLVLKHTLAAMGRQQSELAVAVGLSQSSIAQIINHNLWPRNKDATQTAIRRALAAWGADEATITRALEWDGDAPPDPRKRQQEETIMMRFQRLHPETRRRFNLFRNPFDGELKSAEDIFLTPENRYVQEMMYDAAMNAGFIAVVGESGSGKSTLMLGLHARIKREHAQIVLITPSIIAMEESAQTGRILKADAVADAIIRTLDPRASVHKTMDAKTRRVQELLTQGAESGYSHCVVIEEAHSLPRTTLKHLKRLVELRNGFSRLLGIILIGQPELIANLSVSDARVREVVQRIDIVELPAMEKFMTGYLSHKLERCGKKLEELFEADALRAMAERLKDQRTGMSRAYPLVINNLATACLNIAAGIGAPKVTADIVREAR